ncbi:hypothetical protein L5515_002713 [Caenorhabditis briggsae]|uniref:Uncharacterized protein n=1 Tax=Caenorhabditis briggsae TaxID=6238 RepID=A0AAE9E4Q4_CAEBR|nr:hypothetical protein L5515_002713 [Caenorhabditis briggsae]
MDDEALLDHFVQLKISESHLLDDKVITCAKGDQKYVENVAHRQEEDFPEHIIGCKDFPRDKKIVSVTSRNVLKIRKSKNLELEEQIQCDYSATSICSLILGETLESIRIFFGSVVGELIDWQPGKEDKPVMRKGHKGMIFSIVADSKRIFTISDDRTIRMWAISDRGGSFCTAFGHTARPFTICLDPDSQLIYTGGIEQTVYCWKYTDREIKLTRKTPLSAGVIRKITLFNGQTLAISCQNGDILKIHVDCGGVPDWKVLKAGIVNFKVLNCGLVTLNTRDELKIYTNTGMFKLMCRVGNIKHMSSSSESLVAWHEKQLIVVSDILFYECDMTPGPAPPLEEQRKVRKPHVYRLKLSMNIITALCWDNLVLIKTVDGSFAVYEYLDADSWQCLKRFTPENPSIMPSCFAKSKNYIYMGTTHGELYYTYLEDHKNDQMELALTKKECWDLFGGKEVTCIYPLKLCKPKFMTLGKTGVWATVAVHREGCPIMYPTKPVIHTFRILNSRTFSAASRVAWPCQFIDRKGNGGIEERLIVGFYGTSMIIWNSTTGLPVYETYCGGGHREWQLEPSEEDPSILDFHFIRDNDLCHQRIDLNSKEYVLNTAHSSSIVAASGSTDLLATVSLDGHLSISNADGQLILPIFVGENLLCTDMRTDKGGHSYIIAGGGKSKISIIDFNHSELESHGVFSMRHLSRPEEGRVVSVKTWTEEDSDPRFVVSYSSGVLEVLDFSLKSLATLELEDSLGIGAKIDIYDEDTLIVGTSGSYVLTFELKDEQLKETGRLKLSDRSGVTSIAMSSDAIYVGCDSGHVYKGHVASESSDSESVAKIQSHLSTVVGIVVTKDTVLSISLDCAIVKSVTSSESTVVSSRKPTIIDMPNGMVKMGKSKIVVVGDGIQIIDHLI